MRRGTMTLSALALGLMLANLTAPSQASAESGKLNLHLDIGFGVPIAGDLQIGGTDPTLGGFGWFSADYQPFAPLSFELMAEARTSWLAAGARHKS